MQPQIGVTGFAAPLRAMGFLLARPRLWPLALAPFLVNLVLFALFFWFSFSRFQSWLEAFLPQGDQWWRQILFYLLVVLVTLLLLVIMVYVFAMAGRVLAAPFLEILTQRVEGEFNARGAVETGFLHSIGRALLQESKKFGLFALLMLVLMLFNLIPGLGSVIYACLAFVAASFFLASDFLDYPLERRGLSLMQKLSYVRRLGFTGLSFGASCLVLGMIPLLNLALLPLAAVGGVLLYLSHPLENGRPGAASSGKTHPPAPPLP